MDLSDIVDENNKLFYGWIENHKKESDNLCQVLNEIVGENNASFIKYCANCE